MEYFETENLVDKCAGSIYKLVITAAKRALEIAEGQPKMVEAAPSTKPSTIAIQEIAEGRLQCKKIKPKG